MWSAAPPPSHDQRLLLTLCIYTAWISCVILPPAMHRWKCMCCVSCIIHQCYTFRICYFRAGFLKSEHGLVREKIHPVVQNNIINLWSSLSFWIYFVTLLDIGTYFLLNGLIYFWFASWFAALCRGLFHRPRGTGLNLLYSLLHVL